MNLIDRLVERLAGPDNPAAIERKLREQFSFLEERQGFEVARAKRLEDGAAVAYANRPARRGIVIFARRGRGAWAGVAPLDESGELRPLDRGAVERGEWRELRRVDAPDEEHLGAAVTHLARSLGGSRA